MQLPLAAPLGYVDNQDRLVPVACLTVCKHAGPPQGTKSLEVQELASHAACSSGAVVCKALLGVRRCPGTLWREKLRHAMATRQGTRTAGLACAEMTYACDYPKAIYCHKGFLLHKALAPLK